jgi:hypothetical protein
MFSMDSDYLTIRGLGGSRRDSRAQAAEDDIRLAE